MFDVADAGRSFTIGAVVARLPVEDDPDYSPEGYLATVVSDAAPAASLVDELTDLSDMWARRAMMKLGEDLIRTSRDDNGMSAIERLDSAKNRVDALADPLGSGAKHIAHISDRLLARVQDASNRELSIGLNVGLKAMQDITGALMPGRVYLLAGPPGSGKSALAYQVAEHVAQTEPVLFESHEMEADELAERDLASRTGISAERIERASVNVEELEALYDAADQHRSLQLHIDASSSMTANMIRSQAIQLKRTEGLSLLVIDHLLYIQPADRKMGEFQAIRANMQAVKRIAKDLSIPVLILSQLKKEYSDGTWQQVRRPNVGDLYGGSAVEQEADVILFAHRPEYLLRRKEPAKDAKDHAEWETALEKVAGKAELLIGKRRGGAGYGHRICYFDAPRVKFADVAPSVFEPRNPLFDDQEILF